MQVTQEHPGGQYRAMQRVATPTGTANVACFASTRKRAIEMCLETSSLILPSPKDPPMPNPTQAQWNAIRKATLQYSRDIEAAWQKAKDSTKPLQDEYNKAIESGAPEDVVANLENQIRQHPDMINFLEVQKVALKKREDAIKEIML